MSSVNDITKYIEGRRWLYHRFEHEDWERGKLTLFEDVQDDYRTYPIIIGPVYKLVPVDNEGNEIK